MKRKIFLIVSLFLIFIAGGCQNSVGPVTEFFEIIEPKVNNSQKDTLDKSINAPVIAFKWRGSDLGFEFRYKIERFFSQADVEIYRDLTDWSPGTEVFFDNLNDGKYRFTLEAKFSGQTDKKEVYFEIDAVSDESLTFYKLFTDAQVNTQCTVKVWCEGVNNLAAGDLRFLFDTGYLEYLRVESGKKPGNLQSLIISEPADSVNKTGLLDVSLGFMAGINGNQGQPKDFSGTGDILILYFRPKKAGKTEVEVISNIFVNSLGSQVSLKTPFRGQIEIK